MERKKWYQRSPRRALIFLTALSALLVTGISGCSSGGTGKAEKAEQTGKAGKAEQTEKAEKTEETELQVFLAASLRQAMEEIADAYEKEHPEVKITLHADSSGTLLTQIEAGYVCDIFFSAAQKQMDALEADGLVAEGTRADVVGNELVLIAGKDSRTKVDGLANLGKAESIALAGGSVPAGKYAREALAEIGLLERSAEMSEVTTEEVSRALGGVEISEQSNVSKVLIAVAEHAAEVGFVYASDVCGYEKEVQIIERIGRELTGEITYPVCRVKNALADERQERAAESFLEAVQSEESAAIFERCGFSAAARGRKLPE